MIEKGR